MQINEILEGLKQSRQRVRLFYGKDGTVWPEEHDVLGYIGRSTGTKPCFILIHNTRSTGGPSISIDSIMGIRATNGEWTYRHPNFNVGVWEAKWQAMHRGVIYHNGVFHTSGFPSLIKAENYCDFMRGHRFSK